MTERFDSARPTDSGHTRVSANLTIPVLGSERREATGLVWVEVKDGMTVHRFGLMPEWAEGLARDLLHAAEQLRPSIREQLHRLHNQMVAVGDEGAAESLQAALSLLNDSMYEKGANR